MLPENVSKVTYTVDTKLENAGTFSFMHEDHTMGNLIRMQLHSDKTVVFAGYRIPHPLEARMVVKVQTTGAKSPVEAVEHALQDLRSEVVTLQNEFAREFQRLHRENAAAAAAGHGNL